MRRFITLLLMTLFAPLAQGNQAATPTLERPVFGWVERTRLEPWGVELKAKLDSGALTSSLHARDIHFFDREGEEWVRFTVDVEDLASGELVKREFERPRHRKVRIRGAGGQDRRPVVLMKICMGDTIYEEEFTLRDRANMIYPVLLGRRTLQHLGLLDVTRTFTQPPRCDEHSLVVHDDDLEDDTLIEDDQT